VACLHPKNTVQYLRTFTWLLQGRFEEKNSKWQKRHASFPGKVNFGGGGSKGGGKREKKKRQDQNEKYKHRPPKKNKK